MNCPSHLAVDALEIHPMLKPFWPGHGESNCKIRIIIKKKKPPHNDCLICIYFITSRTNRIQELKQPWQLNAERAVLVNK